MQESRREQNKRKSRERILRASRRLFSAKGFEGTIIDEVAELAGVSRATLYNYFPSKDSLLLGIAWEELDQVRGLIAGELRQVGPLERLRRVLEVFALDSISYLGLSRKIIYLSSFEDGFLHPIRAEMLDIYAAIIEEGKRQGLFRPHVPTDEIVELVMAVYLTVQFGWPHIDKIPPEECTRRLAAMLNQALAGVRA